MRTILTHDNSAFFLYNGIAYKVQDLLNYVYEWDKLQYIDEEWYLTSSKEKKLVQGWLETVPEDTIEQFAEDANEYSIVYKTEITHLIEDVYEDCTINFSPESNVIGIPKFHNCEITGPVREGIYTSCSFIEAKFTDMNNVKISNCLFRECIFTRSNLNNMKFGDSRFVHCVFTDCSACFTNWDNAYMDSNKFYRCELSGSSWINTGFQTFIECNFTNTDADIGNNHYLIECIVPYGLFTRVNPTRTQNVQGYHFVSVDENGCVAVHKKRPRITDTGWESEHKHFIDRIDYGQRNWVFMTSEI
jgi:hypothetical protein